MPQKIYTLFFLQYSIQCLDLPQRHSLVLYEIEIDVVTKKSINDDKSQFLSGFV